MHRCGLHQLAQYDVSCLLQRTMGALPLEAVPVSKSESGARRPASDRERAQRKPGQRRAKGSSCEPVGDIRAKCDDVRFGSKADIRGCVTDVR